MSDVHLLRNSFLQARFSTEQGMPLGCRLCGEEGEIGGALPEESILARVCCLSPREYRDIRVKPVGWDAGRYLLNFRFQVVWDEKATVSFEIRYELDRSAIRVTLEEVEETGDFQLIQVSIPALASVEEQEGAWLAHCRNGGSMVSLTDARPGSLPDHPYFGPILHMLPLVMAGTSQALCALEVTSFNDGVLLEVLASEEGRSKRVRIGTIKTYRVDGSSWCNTNDPDLTLVYGNENTPNLLVEQKSICRLDIAGDVDHNGRVDWLDGAKLMHSRLPSLRTDYYDDKFMYIISCDHPAIPSPQYTLEEAGDLIEQVAALTDYHPQVQYLTGWQIEGMDTGYPAVNEIGARIGGYEAYLRLQKRAEAVGCNLTLHDNFDDAYPHSREWDEDMVARLPDGSLWASNLWTRDVSYIQGLAKYMTKGPGVDRIDYTCRHYRYRNTAHVDVLSWFAIRHDWDPAHPASAIRNLYEGRYKIFDEFAKRGMDLTSESLRWPWIGKMSLSLVELDMWGDCPFGGRRVPIVPTVYRNVAIHGGGDGEDRQEAPLGLRLLYNVHWVHWNPWKFTKEEELERLVDIFYLLYVPWFALHRLEAAGYELTADGTDRMFLADNSGVDYCERTGEYRACWRGSPIASTGSVSCPLDCGRIAFYSLREEILSCPLPEGWNAQCICAQALYADRHEKTSFQVEEGEIRVRVLPRVPVIIRRE